MRSSWYLTVLLIAAASGCRVSSAPPSTSAAPLDSAAFATVIAELHARENRGGIPVAIQFLPLSREQDTPATREWLARELPTVSGSMYEALATPPPASRDVRESLVRVRGAAWIDSTALMSGRDLSTIRFGIRLSPVAYSVDSSQAVIYAVVVCGAVCGSADYFLLERDASSSWRIRKVLRRWTG
jgi:hypothetical protein